jgi:iron(III) transport system substrate-binding protein
MKIHFSKSLSFLIIITVLLLLSACGPSSESNADQSGDNHPEPENIENQPSGNTPSADDTNFPPAIQTLIDGAKGENKLVVFGLSADPDQNKALNKAMGDYYGVEFELSFLSGLHPQKVAEIISSAKAGVPPGVDVFLSSIFDLNELKQENLLADVDWAGEFNVPDEYTTLGGIGIRFFDDTPISVFYNKNLVSDGDIPESYDDLLDPKWKGKITTVRSANWFAMMAGAVGEEYTDQFVGRIADYLVYSKTFPDVLTRVASGEFPLGIGSMPVSAVRKGAPIASAPIDPMVVLPWSSAVLRDAESPNLAKLFVYFISTDEGQKVISENWGYSRLDIEGTYANKMAEGRDVIRITEDFIEQFESVREKYNKLLGFE